MFDFSAVLELLPKLLVKLPITLSIVLVATVAGLAIGLVLAILRIEKIPILAQISVVLVSFLRGTPVLVQMFIVYYGLPLLLNLVGIDISRWDKIVFLYFTYALNAGAFFSEILRSSVLAVPKAQWDAAASVGLTRTQVYRRIILPQSLRIAVPGIGMTMTGLLQDTSLAFALGIVDVIGRVRTLGAFTGHVLEGYLAAGIIFVLLSILLEQVFRFLEKKTKKGVFAQ